MVKARVCEHCGVLMHESKRPQARYCSDSCRVMAYQRRRQLERPSFFHPERSPGRQLSSMMRWFAPHGASGYRLGICLTGKGELTWFPRHGCFSLVPLERPRVPVRGQYRIRFYSENLDKLPTPRALISGLYIEQATSGVESY